ncbi:hypothetical protein Tco_0002487 [Tanacetum coccineum]
MSRLRLSRSHNFLRHSSVRMEPIAIVCSRYSGWIDTLIFSFVTRVLAEGCASGPETIVHSSGIILLLRSVSIPPGTWNFNILRAVDETAWICLTPGLPMIPLYGDNLLLFLFSIGVVIGGGVLNLPLSKAKISFGDFVRSVNLSRLHSDLY